MQVRKSTIVAIGAALFLAVCAYAWIGGGRETVHPIVSEAAAPLIGR